MTDFFKNLKVVELASVLAGPAVGMFFAELGAEVVKIENVTTGGDVTRSWKLPSEAAYTEGSAYFFSVNFGKKHLFLDLQNPADRAVVLDLLADCDVVIANFRKSSALKLGMDYLSVKKINPKAIYGQIVGFDEEDETPAFDVVLQAETGFMFMCGERNRPPVKMPVALIDILAAHQLKEGILLALLAREKSGSGALVTASLYDAAVASLANQATNWLMAQHIPQRIGAEHPNIAPYGDVFVTSDNREIVLACGTEKQWQTLCRVLNLEELITDNRFKTNALRVKNRVELVDILRGLVAQYARDAFLQIMRDNAIPAGGIRDMKEVFDNPRAQALILEEGVASRKTRRVKTAVFKIENK